MIMQCRKWFSIFSCGCNQYKSIHLIKCKDTSFSQFKIILYKKTVWIKIDPDCFSYFTSTYLLAISKFK